MSDDLFETPDDTTHCHLGDADRWVRVLLGRGPFSSTPERAALAALRRLHREGVIRHAYHRRVMGLTVLPKDWTARVRVLLGLVVDHEDARESVVCFDDAEEMTTATIEREVRAAHERYVLLGLALQLASAANEADAETVHMLVSKVGETVIGGRRAAA